VNDYGYQLYKSAASIRNSNRPIWYV